MKNAFPSISVRNAMRNPTLLHPYRHAFFFSLSLCYPPTHLFSSLLSRMRYDPEEKWMHFECGHVSAFESHPQLRSKRVRCVLRDCYNKNRNERRVSSVGDVRAELGCPRDSLLSKSPPDRRQPTRCSYPDGCCALISPARRIPLQDDSSLMISRRHRNALECALLSTALKLQIQASRETFFFRCQPGPCSFMCHCPRVLIKRPLMVDKYLLVSR